ncbi:uncharacterized protein LOC114585114 isoform X1 [Podarcis muralis]
MPNQTFDHISVTEASDKRPASMKVKTALVCAFVIMMVFFVVESSHTPKGNPIARNWGPQSMLYLKGRYGRRYASSDSEEQYYKLDLDDLNAVMKSIYLLQTFSTTEIPEHQKKMNISEYGH